MIEASWKTIVDKVKYRIASCLVHVCTSVSQPGSLSRHKDGLLKLVLIANTLLLCRQPSYAAFVVSQISI